MARVKQFGAPFVPTKATANTTILICGGCGKEVEGLTSYGKKWLCDNCYAGKFKVFRCAEATCIGAKTETCPANCARVVGDSFWERPPAAFWEEVRRVFHPRARLSGGGKPK